MQKIKKASSAIIILVILWMLTGLSIISIAENIPLSEEGLEKLRQNKIRLESGIGVMVFNLSKGELTGDGYLTVSNTYNSSVTLRCKVITRLSKVDLDEDGSYRLHKKISNNIIFESIPDSSWITLEDTTAIVNPYSIYNFRYTVNVDIGYLREQAKKNNNIFNTSEGYLVYINTRKDLGDVTGTHIGIDYDYKLFLVFTGELQEEKQEDSISNLFILLIIPLSIGIGTILFHIGKGNKSKKDKVTPSTYPIHAKGNNQIKTSKDKLTLDDDAMRQKIDNILGRRNE